MGGHGRCESAANGCLAFQSYHSMYVSVNEDTEDVTQRTPVRSVHPPSGGSAVYGGGAPTRQAPLCPYRPPAYCLHGRHATPTPAPWHPPSPNPACRSYQTWKYGTVRSTGQYSTPRQRFFHGFQARVHHHPSSDSSTQSPTPLWICQRRDRDREREVAGFGASSSTTRCRVPSHRGFAPVGAVRSIAAHPPPPFPSLSLAVVLCPDPGKAQVALGD
ncbi:hypothetical protein S7711_10901 [Stachybotrys chartarum IBT 7711]|uniref:Uncharacterized protein n=1 Tax=Stachybotrys chartarum (strain CBS 109288 / IBT 7711) TaxID=1280523 RepID=A0A084AMF3_STACB|nr:hypothetical protein S7711_10901 [Stachybotrys chartarum IBT 7711]